jgi:hypothetical protein
MRYGDRVRCGACNEVVWICVAGRTLKPMDLICSADFVDRDGGPLTSGSIMICPSCYARFSSIDTELGVTVR